MTAIVLIIPSPGLGIKSNPGYSLGRLLPGSTRVDVLIMSGITGGHRDKMVWGLVEPFSKVVRCTMQSPPTL